MELEQLEHQTMQHIAYRVARVHDVTPSLAIAGVRSHVGHLSKPDADLDDAGHWLSIATIAAKQAVLARARKAEA